MVETDNNPGVWQQLELSLIGCFDLLCLPVERSVPPSVGFCSRFDLPPTESKRELSDDCKKARSSQLSNVKRMFQAEFAK